MTVIIDWASQRARMILALIIASLTAGIFSYTGLPKEGEPDIEIPALFISVVANPLVVNLRSKGVPIIGAILIVIFGIVAFGFGVGWSAFP